MGASAQQHVEAMLAEQIPFDEIEDFIEATTLPDDMKSALFLLAYARQEQDTQTSIALSIVGLG